MLETLRAIPRVWLASGNFTGPRGWLSGCAHQLAGRTIAPQAEWGGVLAVVEQRLAEKPAGFDPVFATPAPRVPLCRSPARRVTRRVVCQESRNVPFKQIGLNFTHNFRLTVPMSPEFMKISSGEVDLLFNQRMGR